MAIGDRIKRARLFRGLTQKELGRQVGFDEKTADVRIAQYESGVRTPKEDLLREIAEVLDVNYRSLYEPTLYAAEDLMYTLFELDEHYDIELHEIPDPKYPKKKHIAVQFHSNLLDSFLIEWTKRKKTLPMTPSARPNIRNGNLTGRTPPTTTASTNPRRSGVIDPQAAGTLYSKFLFPCVIKLLSN